MPGILNLAPERTDTRSGFSGSPRPLPVCCSTTLTAARTSSQRPAGASCPRRSSRCRLGGDGEARGSRQTCVGHLREAGTLAASRSFIPPLPSALRRPRRRCSAWRPCRSWCQSRPWGFSFSLDAGTVAPRTGGSVRRGRRDGGELVPQRSGIERLDVNPSCSPGRCLPGSDRRS